MLKNWNSNKVCDFAKICITNCFSSSLRLFCIICLIINFWFIKHKKLSFFVEWPIDWHKRLCISVARMSYDCQEALVHPWRTILVIDEYCYWNIALDAWLKTRSVEVFLDAEVLFDNKRVHTAREKRALVSSSAS